MKIQSDYLSEGLFAQAFVWMLEILPYVKSQGWKPAWQIHTRNYGQPPDYNIFPGIIRTLYTPDEDGQTVSFEYLQQNHPKILGFSGAAALWNDYFRFTDDVYERLEQFSQTNMSEQTVLGLHFRGTDKNRDQKQTNPVTPYQFLYLVEHFLERHPDVTSIFVATDEDRFLQAVGGLSPRVYYHRQARSSDGSTLWNNHRELDNQSLAKDAILDCLTLSRCRYVLKGMSQLSAFAKVLNPELEIYRVTACKPSWFPELGIPLYRSNDRAVRALLRVLQEGDCSHGRLKRSIKSFAIRARRDPHRASGPVRHA